MNGYLPKYLWFLPLLPLSGAVIDFLLGKAGRERVRDRLESWWIRFDDIEWSNFGKAEAVFAHDLIGRWFGRSIFSKRRWLFVFGFILFFYVVGFLVLLVWHGAFGPFIPPDAFAFYAYTFDVVALVLSISYTRLLSRIVSGLCGDNGVVNFVVFLIFLLIVYFSMVAWVPLLSIIRTFFAFPLSEDYHKAGTGVYWVEPFVIAYYIMKVTAVAWTPFAFFQEMVTVVRMQYVLVNQSGYFAYFPINFAMLWAGYFPNLMRLILLIVFVGSFLFQPFIKRPISLIMLRVAEHKTPVFTLITAGMAGIIYVIWTVWPHII